MQTDRSAIGNNIGIPAPNIKVINEMFNKYEYLKCKRYSGPLYNFTYSLSDFI
jgi:hypothetical protein